MNTTFLTQDQDKQLHTAITNFVKNYISDNKIAQKYKDTIINDKYDDIIFNINSSEQLRNDINNGKVNIIDLPDLEPYKLDNNLWKTYVDRRDKNIKVKENMATVNIYTCKKCGEKKCITYQLQTASIDEPMTTYIICTNCGNKWKH